MARAIMIAFFGILVLATALSAGPAEQIKELRQEIKTIQGQRDQAVKAVHTHYEGILHLHDRPEQEKARMRNALAGQERELLRAAKEREEQTIKRIHEHYDFLIHRERHSEAEKEKRRWALARQERELLCIASSEQERERIRARYDHLRRCLSGEIRLDEKEIAELHEQEKEHIEHARRVFHEECERIRERFHLAGKYLNSQERLSDAQIREVREAEKKHTNQVRVAHDIKIKELERAIKFVESQPKPKGGPPTNQAPKKK